MNAKKSLAALLALALLTVLLSACKAKDIVALAGLDKSGLRVGDRFGNKVSVPNAEEFLAAMKEAKVVSKPNPEDVKPETLADYIFTSGEGKVYYDYDGKYLIHVDKNQKKTVYSCDLTSLLEGVPGLPPRISVGLNQDSSISPMLAELSKVKMPSAALFEAPGKSVLMVAAGEKPTGGYVMSLDGVTYTNGTLIVKVRLTNPANPTDTVLSYPYIELGIYGQPDVEVQLISQGSSGDKVEHVSLGRVAQGQNVIMLHPERGALLTERVRITGFARVPDGTFTIEVQDANYILGKKTVNVTERAPDWGYFEFDMDLISASSANGLVVIYRTEGGRRVEELIVPVSFGGK
ncbi:MAG TPA: protease complex subunit PrcB family protein [Firmicutes bacterium]|nr:protease complex subunit PrcB family protein [Candidatus Fermentithermobacillaceae bacterium]